ncbi:hypothetical protein BH23ACT11_BH23ACT11_08260 [soil metagenome]
MSLFPTNILLATDGTEKSIVGHRGGKVADSHIVPGDKPAKEIVKLTRGEDIGMVVIGSRDLSRLQYALQGSVSSQVVRDAYCPVLVVHGEHEV